MKDVSKSTLKLYIALSFSVFIWKWNNKIHSRSFLKIHTQFQTKMGKMYTSFRPKRPKNHTLWGSTYLQSNLSNTDTKGTERCVRIREATMMMSFLSPHWWSLMLFIEWTMEQFELRLLVLIISCYSCIEQHCIQNMYWIGYCHNIFDYCICNYKCEFWVFGIADWFKCQCLCNHQQEMVHAANYRPLVPRASRIKFVQGHPTRI